MMQAMLLAALTRVFKRGSREGRSPIAFLSAAVLAMALVAQPSRAAVPNPKDQLELQALLTCYAYAFDSIDRATFAVAPVPPNSLVNFDNDPRWAEGAQRFLDCTTDDFTLTLLIDGDLAFQLPGALSWVNVVSNMARFEGRRNSQHMMGTFDSTVDPGKGTPQEGTVTAYSVVRIMYLPDSPRAGNVDVLTVTYTATARRVQGRWKMAALEFNLISLSTEAGRPPLDGPPVQQ